MSPIFKVCLHTLKFYKLGFVHSKNLQKTSLIFIEKPTALLAPVDLWMNASTCEQSAKIGSTSAKKARPISKWV
jgi:hypothetical protein